MEIPEISWSSAEASIAASMQGVPAVTPAAVEARSAAYDRGQGLLPIMRAHLRYIYGIAGDKDIPSIWREMALARTKA